MRPEARFGGIAGPVSFIAAWALLGSRVKGYSPVVEPISRLAAVDSSTRWEMTGGMIALAAGLGSFAPGLAPGHPHAFRSAQVASAATLGIALTPLNSSFGGAPHAVAAGVAYASLAAIPALVALDRFRRGDRRAVNDALAAGATAIALGLSVVGSSRTGAWQRLGLTVGHLWIAHTAWRTPRVAA